MISSEVQRTLVKSPPELWAELSDPTALAKHLGEFGEIRITRVEPEQRVEWEAADTSGSVVIKPSGWGTKVKLTVIRELPEPEPEATDAPERAVTEPTATTAEPESAAEPEPPATLPEPPTAPPKPIAAFEPQPLETGELVEPEYDEGDETELVAEADFEDETRFEDERTPESETDFEDEPECAQPPALELLPDLEPRRGFLARLLSRFRAEPPADLEPLGEEQMLQAPITDDLPEPPRDLALGEPTYEALGEIAAWAPSREGREDEPQDEPQPAQEAIEPPDAEPEFQAAAGAQQAEPATAQSQVAPEEVTAQTIDVEEQATEQVTAVLTGVLDRLGAAHHRPFSRA
jgi:hypothetical protein